MPVRMPCLVLDTHGRHQLPSQLRKQAARLRARLQSQVPEGPERLAPQHDL